jgi:SAM-dependent methyltransferase
MRLVQETEGVVTEAHGCPLAREPVAEEGSNAADMDRRSADGPQGMSVRRQIEMGCLVCPRTKRPLQLNDRTLTARNPDQNEDQEVQYQMRNGSVPILLNDPRWQEAYANESIRMNEEYAFETVSRGRSLMQSVKAFLTQDYRTASSRKAFENLFQDLPRESLCLSIGGGPTRNHPRLFNVNIGPFPNVDVVADAHCLPYAADCVDAVHCEAVLEHLYDPVTAVNEMYRVLKPGGKAFVCTPFLQGYHGYPHHYQNYTLTGQRHLLRSAGFEVSESGVCVGPVYTLVSFIAGFLHEYVPSPLNVPLRYLWGMVGAFIRPLDKIIAPKENAHIFASTTYVLAVKRPA